jgi:hypothetical protein
MFKWYHLNTLSVDDYVKYTAHKEIEKKNIIGRVQKTTIFGNLRRDLLYIDDKHGIWCVLFDKNPDIFYLDQVKDCYFASSTARSIEDWHYTTNERKSVYSSIIVELEHPYIEYVKIAISDTESDTYSSDEAVGN